MENIRCDLILLILPSPVSFCTSDLVKLGGYQKSGPYATHLKRKQSNFSLLSLYRALVSILFDSSRLSGNAC